MGLDLYFKRTHSEEIGYFRKVNFLVSFFSEVCNREVENLVPIEITKEDCIELLNRCNKVLESKTDEVSESLLPTCSGLFFGNYEYNEYYFEDVEQVRDYCQEILLPLFDEIDTDEYITFEIWY